MTTEAELAEQGWMSSAELSRRGWETLERAQMLNMHGGHTGLTGITSGFGDLDSVTSGWHPGDLVIAAGRPGIGKTTFALHMAVAAGATGVETAFISMEMTPTACWTRIVSAMGPQEERPLRSGYAAPAQYSIFAKTIERFNARPMVWKDGSRLTPEQLRAQVRWLQSREMCRMLVLDQLGNLIPPNPRENKVQQVSALAAACKSLAQEFGIPVIATHQLNRESEKSSAERRPEIWHLRDSGVVEQEADVVLLLHRTWTPSPTQPIGPIEVNVAKNRRGMMPLLSFTYSSTETRFSDAVL